MRPRHSDDPGRAHRVEVVRSFCGGESRTRLELANQLGLSVATICIMQLTPRGGGSLVVGWTSRRFT